jgi:hypothetical protein
MACPPPLPSPRQCLYLEDGSNRSLLKYWYVSTRLHSVIILNDPLTHSKPNDPYRGRTPPLTSKRCILHIYSTNIATEYFKHGIYSPSFSLQNAVCFIIVTYLVPVLFTFYIQGVLKLKKNSGAKRLTKMLKVQLRSATQFNNKLTDNT